MDMMRAMMMDFGGVGTMNTTGEPKLFYTQDEVDEISTSAYECGYLDGEDAMQQDLLSRDPGKVYSDGCWD
jgi:hypothetical protein